MNPGHTPSKKGPPTSSILGSAPNATPRCTIVGRWDSSRQRPLAAPQSGPTRTMIGRRGVSDAAAARICSPTHFDSPCIPPAASHALTGPSTATEPAASLPGVDLRALDAPRSVSVELMNMRRGGVGRGLERAKSTRLRSMWKLLSKMLRGRLSSCVDNHALCTMWVTEERSCEVRLSVRRDKHFRSKKYLIVQFLG